MTQQTIAVNLLLGHNCSNCAHAIDSIEVTSFSDVEKSYIPPHCCINEYSNTCAE